MTQTFHPKPTRTKPKEVKLPKGETMSKETLPILQPNQTHKTLPADAMEHAISTSNDVLWTALGSYRPDGSQGIQNLMSRLINLAPPTSTFTKDGANNLWIDTRTDTTPSKTLFCAHLDAVHPRKADGPIKLYWNEGRTSVSTLGEAVLGADDGAGVAILAALIAANVPGLYLFTQGEETGGHGMKHAVAKLKHKVEGIDRAIAFDRRGSDEICGEQMIGTLASVEFVEALADGLGLGHRWGRGTYTDNCEWEGIIPEIVNVSVGYENNHSKAETLDWIYFQKLRLACLAMDWESLPTLGPAIEDPIVFYPEEGGELPREIDGEAWDLCDSFGVLPSSYEGELILDALSRAYRLGYDDGTYDSLPPKRRNHFGPSSIFSR